MITRGFGVKISAPSTSEDDGDDGGAIQINSGLNMIMSATQHVDVRTQTH